jgi:hypothetical protein
LKSNITTLERDITMPEAVDFQSVMAELTVFQNAIGKIQANLKNAKNKEILGDVLAKVQQARSEVEIEYPKAMNLIEENAKSVLAEAEQGLAQMDQKRADYDQKAAAFQAAKKQAGQLPAPPEAKIDPAMGMTLRNELLNRFGPQTLTENGSSEKIREAWQDWN